jgi:ABC-type nitrate/sulfonate/bicarbonate transport system permease component
VTSSGATAKGSGLSGSPQRRLLDRIPERLRSERFAYGAVGVIGFLLLWEFSSKNEWVNPRWFPAPSLIFAAGLNEIQDPDFPTWVARSTYEFVVGFGLAIIVGIPLGLATGWFKRLNYALDPWINFFNALPRIALLPILVIMFGIIGPNATIAVVFLGAFISILVVTVMGVRTVDRRYLDVANSFNASQTRIFTSVVALATVPFIITGLRIGMARALIGVVTGELYAAFRPGGIATELKFATNALQIDRMLFFVLIFTTMGIIGVQIIKAVERRFQRWRPEQEI